jgi:hypothetical protein
MNLRRAAQGGIDVEADVAVTDVLVEARVPHHGRGLFARAAQD